MGNVDNSSGCELHATCPMCDKEYIMSLTKEEENKLDEYNSGKGFIQDIFSDFNPMEREFIKTGYCPKCQKRIFRTNYTSDKIREEE